MILLQGQVFGLCVSFGIVCARVCVRGWASIWDQPAHCAAIRTSGELIPSGT